MQALSVKGVCKRGAEDVKSVCTAAEATLSKCAASRRFASRARQGNSDRALGPRYRALSLGSQLGHNGWNGSWQPPPFTQGNVSTVFHQPYAKLLSLLFNSLRMFTKFSKDCSAALKTRMQVKSSIDSSFRSHFCSLEYTLHLRPLAAETSDGQTKRSAPCIKSTFVPSVYGKRPSRKPALSYLNRSATIGSREGIGAVWASKRLRRGQPGQGR